MYLASPKKGKWKKRKKLLEKYFSISKQPNCQSQLATPTKGKKIVHTKKTE